MDATLVIERLRMGLLAAISTVATACNDDGVRDLCVTTSSRTETEEAYVCYDPAAASGSTSEQDATSTTDGTASSTGGDTGLPNASATGTGDGGLCSGFASGPPENDYDEWSGPTEDQGQCCFTVRTHHHEACGRPLYVNGRMRVAPSVTRSDWGPRLRPRLEGIDAQTREALALAWLADAAAEHASVASFARFALQLMAVGAPAELLVETQRAIADEIEHARLCYALASAYAGDDLGPDRLPLEGVLPSTIDLTALAVSTIHEGCRGETLAALQAHVASGRTTDPVVRAVLRRIAIDEEQHAALAWRFVAWALHRGGDLGVRRAIEQAFAAPAVRVSTREAEGPDLSPHGRLPPAELASLHMRAESNLVRPLAQALLQPDPARRRSISTSSSPMRA